MSSKEERIKHMCCRIAANNVPLPVERNEKGEINRSKLSESEDTDILILYFTKSPLKFLQKYKQFLKVEDVECFNDYQQDDSISFHIKDICLQSTLQGGSLHLSNRVKNRRYNAMRRLMDEETSTYFNMVSLKKRYPKIYDQYIGRYLSAEEKESMLKDELKSENQATTLSSLLLKMMEKDMNRIYPSEETEEQGEEFDSSSDEEMDPDEEKITDQEKEILREEFLSKVQSMFLAGEDPTFDYKSVDEDSSYDDLLLVERDSQDHYFDEEEASSDKINEEKEDGSEEDELDSYMNEINAKIS